MSGKSNKSKSNRRQKPRRFTVELPVEISHEIDAVIKEQHVYLDRGNLAGYAMYGLQDLDIAALRETLRAFNDWSNDCRKGSWKLSSDIDACMGQTVERLRVATGGKRKSRAYAALISFYFFLCRM